MKRHKTAGRRLAVVGLGFAFILAGLAVFVFSGEIALRLSSYVDASEASSGTITSSYLPYAVFGFALSLIGVGAGLIRTVFHTSVQGLMTGSSGAGPAGFGDSQAPLDSLAAGALRQGGVRLKSSEGDEMMVVRIKCRNCGNLEAEDAAFCRKCGQSL